MIGFGSCCCCPASACLKVYAYPQFPIEWAILDMGIARVDPYRHNITGDCLDLLPTGESAWEGGYYNSLTRYRMKYTGVDLDGDYVFERIVTDDGVDCEVVLYKDEYDAGTANVNRTPNTRIKSIVITDGVDSIEYECSGSNPTLDGTCDFANECPMFIPGFEITSFSPRIYTVDELAGVSWEITGDNEGSGPYPAYEDCSRCLIDSNVPQTTDAFTNFFTIYDSVHLRASFIRSATTANSCPDCDSLFAVPRIYRVYSASVAVESGFLLGGSGVYGNPYVFASIAAEAYSPGALAANGQINGIYYPSAARDPSTAYGALSLTPSPGTISISATE